MNQITMKDVVVISGSPENVLDGVPGDKAYDALAGALYVKQFGNGPVGWVSSIPPNVEPLYQMSSSIAVTGTTPTSIMGMGTGSLSADISVLSPGDTIQLSSTGPATVDPNEGSAPLSQVSVVATNGNGTNVAMLTANVDDIVLGQNGNASITAKLVYLGNGNFNVTIDPSPAGAPISGPSTLDYPDNSLYAFDMVYSWPTDNPLDVYTPASASAIKITAPALVL